MASAAPFPTPPPPHRAPPPSRPRPPPSYPRPPPSYPRSAAGISPSAAPAPQTTPQPSSRPPVRRPKLDLGPIRRPLAARRLESSCERASAVARPPGAANSVGYGPQIKFGATEKEHRVMEATGHLPPSRPRPTTVIPAPRHRHTRAPPPSYPRPAAGISTSVAPAPRTASNPLHARRSVAPNLIWGPYGGGRRRGIPSRPANVVGGPLHPQRCEQRWAWPPNQVWGDGKRSTA